MPFKFSSKEIHFLKSESDDRNVSAPDRYYTDLLLSKSEQVLSFEKRLEDAEIPGDSFLCAVLKVSEDISDTLVEKVRTAFETTFNHFLNHDRGLWETIEDTAFALAFWDYGSEERAVELIRSLKDRLSKALNTDILAGVALFPFHDFSETDTFENAVKAMDHAAFFGPDSLIRFDSVSLNISGDRFYQLQEIDRAMQDYVKGLEITPKDINLINSLGVCYGVTGELELARKEFERANQLNPGEVMVLYNIALLHRIDDNPDKAEIYLKKAHAIDDRTFEVELLLGRLLFSDDRTDQAFPHLERAAGINPDSAAAHRMIGEILLSDKDEENAAAAFNRAIKLNPSDAVSLSGYARCLDIQEKNLQIALSFARNSVALEPDNALFKRRLESIREKIEGPAEQTPAKSA